VIEFVKRRNLDVEERTLATHETSISAPVGCLRGSAERSGADSRNGENETQLSHGKPPYLPRPRRAHGRGLYRAHLMTGRTTFISIFGHRPSRSCDGSVRQEVTVRRLGLRRIYVWQVQACPTMAAVRCWELVGLPGSSSGGNSERSGALGQGCRA